VGPVPAQIRQGRAQSRCGCGRGGPSPGSDEAGAGPVPAAGVAGVGRVPGQMRQGRAQSRQQVWQGWAESRCRCRLHATSPGADAAAVKKAHSRCKWGQIAAPPWRGRYGMGDAPSPHAVGARGPTSASMRSRSPQAWHGTEHVTRDVCRAQTSRPPPRGARRMDRLLTEGTTGTREEAEVHARREERKRGRPAGSARDAHIYI
jgi:hypothetical protein